MQLKCAEYLKEAVTTNNEQARYTFMSKACKQIAQLLPFQSMWHLLLKQDQLFFYMLMLQSMFGQNIKMLLELIIERFAPITQFQIQFLNACSQIFQQDINFLSDVMKSHISGIFKECIVQLQFFIKQIPKNDSKEGQSVAEQITQAYKAILQNIHDEKVTLELYNSFQGIVNKWPLIHELNPLIFHEIEEIIATRTPRNVEIQIIEDYLECESPTRSNSIRKENQVVVELQRWLSKLNYPIPVISKKIASSVINSQNMFKLKDNLEIMLSFIYCPLKYEPASCWSRIELNKTINQKDIPNLKDCFNLNSPAHLYHIRSIRSLQSLTDDENHSIIAKVNPAYLKIAFSYLSKCFDEDQLKYCNFNHLTQLLTFYLEKEQDISVYFILYYNIPYAFFYYINYEQASSFLIHLFTQINLMTHNQSEHTQLLYEQVWNYFKAANLFTDLINTLFNPTQKSGFILKCSQDFRNNQMIEVFKLNPDFQLKEKIYQQNDNNNFNYILEEKIHLKWDIDQLKHFIHKKTIKQLSFFNKSINNIIPLTIEKPASMMDVIRKAIQNVETVSEPHKKKQINTGRERLIVLRSASLMFDLEEQDQVKDPFLPYDYNPNPLELRLETKESNNKFDQKSQTLMKDSQKNLFQKHSRNQSFQLYPLSLNDIIQGKWDQEQLSSQFQIENLIKDEPFCYNLTQFLSILIQHLILAKHNLIQKKNCTIEKREQYLGIIFQEINTSVFDNLIKIYLFKIKISPYVKENSAILCGKLVNFILKQKPDYVNFQDNGQIYVDYLCKIIINSLSWKTQNDAKIELDISKILLLETLCLLIENGVQRGQLNLLNRITATTWSCLIEICKHYLAIRPNQIYQGLFLRILKLNMEFGSDFNIHTIFMKLNLLSILKQLSELTQQNGVPNKRFSYLNQFIKSACSLLQQYINKNSSKECFKIIQNLDSWKLLKQQYRIHSHYHASSFYSVDSRVGNNSTPATNQSLAKIRIRRSTHSKIQKE
ncbi:unnamed protein product [Paramecium sonneborni]|uniref:Uncharacterized protein n=1 Tax=Paramecium sonneborni TaxID=65129 RepID=A0A8S1N402_9CILI|nr:unnamed protein product [Paramecium sonneborni]